MAHPHFTRELFRFLLDLEGHNDREWFQANRDRYEAHLKQPALRFIADFSGPLHAISPHFRADPRPVGGSLFRIHRDIRFSRDKSPYKTHCGIQFRHERGKDAHAPGFYLHLEPGGCFAALGCWRPETGAQKRIRDAIAREPDRWQQVLRDEPFRTRYRRFGDRLKRVPRGFPADHPAAEELKWKDFGAVASLTQRDVLARDFCERLAVVWQEGAPMMRFLCEALKVKF